MLYLLTSDDVEKRRSIEKWTPADMLKPTCFHYNDNNSIVFDHLLAGVAA